MTLSFRLIGWRSFLAPGRPAPRPARPPGPPAAMPRDAWTRMALFQDVASLPALPGKPLRLSPSRFSDTAWKGPDLERLGYDALRGVSPDRVTMTTFKGRPAIRMEVRPNDAPLSMDRKNGRDRLELVSSRRETHGTEARYRWSVNVEQMAAEKWNLITQFHQKGGLGGGPNMSLSVKRDKDNRQRLHFTSKGGTVAQPEIKGWDLAPLEKGKWYDFELRVRWAHDHTGYVQLFMNGQEVIPKTFKPTIYEGNSVHLQQGLYRGHHQETTSVLYQTPMQRTAL